MVGLLGSLLADACLKDFRKIPFTCSYPPGKKVNQIFWLGVVPLLLVIHKLVELEQRGMASRLGYLAMAVILGAAAFGARRVANNSVNGSGQEIQFEESPSEGVIVLRLKGVNAARSGPNALTQNDE